MSTEDWAQSMKYTYENIAKELSRIGLVTGMFVFLLY